MLLNDHSSHSTCCRQLVSVTDVRPNARCGLLLLESLLYDQGTPLLDLPLHPPLLLTGPPDDGPYRGRYYERGPYHPMDRPPYDRYERYGRFDGPPGALRFACCALLWLGVREAGCTCGWACRCRHTN